MVSIDIVSAYIICGAGSIVGAGVMMLARPSDAPTRRALRICSLAFVIMGLALVQFIAGTAAPSLASLLIAVQGTFMGTAVVAWSFGELNGRRVNPLHVALVIVAGCAAAWAASLRGPQALNIAYCAMALATGLWIVAIQWNYLVAPRNLAERAMGIGLLLYSLSWALRLAFALPHDGAVTNFFYGPPLLQSAFGIFYGVIPIIIPCLVLNLVNARLAERVAARAMTDELTGAFTRRALYDGMPELQAAARAAGHGVALLLLDLDHFKRINDGHGHLAGDQVLRRTALMLQETLRPGAVLARFGGEEFVIALAVDDLHAARRVAERLRTRLAAQAITTGDTSMTVTASIGVALMEADEALDDGLHRADLALYRAKEKGRNRVEAWVARAA